MMRGVSGLGCGRVLPGGGVRAHLRAADHPLLGCQTRPAVLAVLALLVRLDVELTQLERKRHLLLLLLFFLDALGHRRRRGGQRRRRRLDVRRRPRAHTASERGLLLPVAAVAVAAW